jgi:hypothetical protein
MDPKMAGLMLAQSRSHASSTAVRNSAFRTGRVTRSEKIRPLTYRNPSSLWASGASRWSVRGVEVVEQVAELGADVGPVGGGVVADEGGEQVWCPHVGVVAEHEEEDAGEGDGDLVVPIFSGVSGGMPSPWPRTGGP